MSPQSLRLLETALVSAFVSFGVAAAVLHANEPTAAVAAQRRESESVLAPLLRRAVEADEALGLDGPLDGTHARRVESLYRWYIREHEKLAASSTLEWAQTRADGMRRIQKNMAELRSLEAEGKSLEELARGE